MLSKQLCHEHIMIMASSMSLDFVRGRKLEKISHTKFKALELPPCFYEAEINYYYRDSKIFNIMTFRFAWDSISCSFCSEPPHKFISEVNFKSHLDSILRSEKCMKKVHDFSLLIEHMR